MIVSGVKSQSFPEELRGKESGGGAGIRLTRDNQAKPYPMQEAKEVLGDPSSQSTSQYLLPCGAPGTLAPRHPESFPSLSLYAENTASEVTAHCH